MNLSKAKQILTEAGYRTYRSKPSKATIEARNKIARAEDAWYQKKLNELKNALLNLSDEKITDYILNNYSNAIRRNIKELVNIDELALELYNSYKEDPEYTENQNKPVIHFQTIHSY